MTKGAVPGLLDVLPPTAAHADDGRLTVGGCAVARLQTIEDRAGREGDDLVAAHFSRLSGGFAGCDERRELHRAATLSRLDR